MIDLNKILDQVVEINQQIISKLDSEQGEEFYGSDEHIALELKASDLLEDHFGFYWENDDEASTYMIKATNQEISQYYIEVIVPILRNEVSINQFQVIVRKGKSISIVDGKVQRIGMELPSEFYFAFAENRTKAIIEAIDNFTYKVGGRSIKTYKIVNGVQHEVFFNDTKIK